MQDQPPERALWAAAVAVDAPTPPSPSQTPRLYNAAAQGETKGGDISVPHARRRVTHSDTVATAIGPPLPPWHTPPLPQGVPSGDSTDEPPYGAAHGEGARDGRAVRRHESGRSPSRRAAQPTGG